MRRVTKIDVTNEKRKIRVAAYCRVSSDSDDQMNSYQVQINVYTRMIEAKEEWELVGIFADEGISGTSTYKREAFLEMIELCEEGKIDLIITKSISRFARNAKESLEYIRRLKHIGVGVYFEKETINTLQQGDEMLLNVFSAIAQEESKSISQNLKMSIHKRMEIGEYVDPNAPYGYRLLDKHLEIYEPEAYVVRKIFRLFLEGWSTTEIARELIKLGIPTKTENGNWSSRRIAYILSNERYVGDCLYKKSYSEVIVPFKKRVNRGEVEQIYVSHTHEPIIDRTTFDRVQELLKKKQMKFSSAKERQEYILSNLMTCAACGSKYIRRNVNGTIKWGCRKHIEDKSMCSSKYYSEAELLETLALMINKLRFGNVRLLARLIECLEQALNEYRWNNPNARRIANDREKLNAKLHTLSILQSKGYIEPDMYQAQVVAIERDVSRLKAGSEDVYVKAIKQKIGSINWLIEKLWNYKEPITIEHIHECKECFESLVIQDGMIKATVFGNIELSEGIGGVG